MHHMTTGAHRTGSIHALVVDDDLIFVDRILRVLQSMGLAATTARDAEQAAERLESCPPSLVLVNCGSERLAPHRIVAAAKQASPTPYVLAYGPHVRLGELAGPLRSAGADRVVANSAVHARLPELLRDFVDPPSSEPAAQDRASTPRQRVGDG